jgi:putative ABC transport system substrate-binding protein
VIDPSRRLFLCLGLSAVVGVRPVRAQPKIARVGYLSAGQLDAGRLLFAEAFKGALREGGWVEGQNLVIEYRFATEDYERFRKLAADLIRLKIDVLFANSAPAAQAAKEIAATVPIVFVTLNDPVRAGWVASFARPGGNMTGHAGLGPELDHKRLEFLKDAVASTSPVIMLANPSNPMTAPRLTEMELAARALKMPVRVMKASDIKGLEQVLDELARRRVAGLVVLDDPMFVFRQQQIIEFVAKHRIPTIYALPEAAEQGGLIGYGPSLREMHRQAGTYVDRILKGARPADLPVLQPTRFELVINVKTAKALGLTLPQSLLGRADKVIE